MAFSPLEIRFIRDSNTSLQDDVLSIIPNENSSRTYILTYTDHDSRVRNQLEATMDEITDFVYDAFELLAVDEEPFEYVQLTAPAFPTVLVSSRRLENSEFVRDSLVRVIRNTLRNYPDKVSYARERRRILTTTRLS